MHRTYCNPLPLPNYQRGICSLNKKDPFGWLHDVHRDFREMADPTVIRFENRWYLYPSCGMCWVSDNMIDWVHHPIEPKEPGYAPTVVQCKDWFYLTACGKRMWRSRHPLGPWEMFGNVLDENGEVVDWADPMLFVDDDGTMYCYNGLGMGGIHVVRLRKDEPNRYAEPRQQCFTFNPEHVWERRGEYNQDPTKSYIEGAWMTKHQGRYYLQYSGPGTEVRNYAVGCYVSDSPIGPWRYQKRNPILLAPRSNGVVNGCAHHSMVEGPDGSLWCFYTTLVRVEHWFERRVGMDPAGFDENGELFVAGPTETPQWAPGVKENPQRDNSAGLLPLSVSQPVLSSSYAPGHEPVYAVDDNIRTFWQAASADSAEEWLSVDLVVPFNVSAARILFGDRGLDYDAGVLPGPYQFRLEGSLDGKTWQTLSDCSHNDQDKHITYETFPTQRARHIRLLLIGWPEGVTPSLWEFTIFGRH